MKINYKELIKEEIDKGIFRIWLIDERVGASNFFMRIFEILPMFGTKEDSHPYEHGIFMLEGEGIVKLGRRSEIVREGDVLYIPQGEVHSIKNLGENTLKFLCIVPYSYVKHKGERKKWVR